MPTSQSIFSDTSTVINELARIIDLAVSHTFSIKNKDWNELVHMVFKWNQILIQMKNEVITYCPPFMNLIIAKKYKQHLQKLQIFHQIRIIRYKDTAKSRMLKIKYGY